MDAGRGLPSLLSREQRSFLGRSRRGWAPHLARARTFLGEGLEAGPALVLGAGSGLEVPWERARAGTVGWDADPWSRIRTFLRHRVWPEWVFGDLTGGMAELQRIAWRTARQPWSGRPRATFTAIRRLAGLLGDLRPDAGPLEAWIQARHPERILAANVMGQFGVVARRAVERAFAPLDPWGPGEVEDPLDKALGIWTARTVVSFLAVLERSGAELWLVHDRGVVFGETGLGPLREPWTAQLQAPGPLEADDPLCGVDVLQAFQGREVDRHQRWLWRIAPAQVHVVEALRVGTRQPLPLAHSASPRHNPYPSVF
jgi:hypothetical protein